MKLGFRSFMGAIFCSTGPASAILVVGVVLNTAVVLCINGYLEVESCFARNYYSLRPIIFRHIFILCMKDSSNADMVLFLIELKRDHAI